MVLGPPEASYTGIAVVGSWTGSSSRPAIARGLGTFTVLVGGAEAGWPAPGWGTSGWLVVLIGGATARPNPNSVRPAAPATSTSPPPPMRVGVSLVSRETLPA